jgi:ADP-ribose pyrophosphatase
MKKLGRKTVYESNWLNLYLDRVEMNDKSIIENYHVIKYQREGVTVVVENKNEEILFVKAYRYLLDSAEWETPAGGTEKGEDILKTGEREVLEESGYHIKNLKYLFSYFPASGSNDLKFHVLKAVLDEEKERENFDINEIADVKWIKKDKIKELIKNNELKDGLTLSALMYYLFLDKE